MSLKQKAELTIDMISNGVVVSYKNVGEWQTNKVYFETRDEALSWITNELNKEFSWSAKEETKEPKTVSDEIPF